MESLLDCIREIETDVRLSEGNVERLRTFFQDNGRIEPISPTCPICYEDCIYSLPEVKNSKYTHLFCCSKIVCDTCVGKFQSKTCPFCNYSMINLLMLRIQDRTAYQQKLVAGVLRGDAHSAFTLGQLIQKHHEPLAKRMLRAAAASKFQPAMLREALCALRTLVAGLTPARIFACLLRNEEPLEDGFRREIIPLLKHILPCETVSDVVEKLAEKEPHSRMLAIENGIGVGCDYCSHHSATYACPCGKTVYCNQTCQARHWNMHDCTKTRVQLVGLSAQVYNGKVGQRTEYRERSQRYVVNVCMGDDDDTVKRILVKPANAFVLLSLIHISEPTRPY